MLNSLLHEAFYTAGTWVDEPMGLYVGWVARQGSFADRMPIRNETGDVTLIFSGEEYPDPLTVQRLQAAGHEFETKGPSYLVHQYEEGKSAFPAALNGRFHGLLTDRNLGTATLFNDRFGMHRLYYHESDDSFYFSSEAKAILAVRPELRKIHTKSLGEFVSTGAVLENRSLFERIFVLPPGSAWSFRAGTIESKLQYFDASEWERQDQLDAEGFYRLLREVFTRNLPRYFVSNEPIAMSLSGGLDTRMILASRNASAWSLPCYTFGSMFRENEDVRVARRVAQACNQSLEVLTAGAEFLSEFQHYAERAVYLTDGCVDVGRAPDLYLNEKAREIAPVRMTGNYGGEILRQVRAFKPEPPTGSLFSSELNPYIDQAADTYSRLAVGHPATFSAFKQAPWHHYGILALEQTQLSMRSPFLDNDLVKAVFQAPLQSLSSSATSLRLIEDGNPALSEIPTDRGLAGKQGSLQMLKSRLLLDFLFKAEYAYDMGMPQWLSRVDHIFAPFHLEKLFLGRHKVFHFRVWFRSPLANYVQDMLLDRTSLSRPYVSRSSVESAIRKHIKGVANYTEEIQKLLTLEILHRQFVDQTDTHATLDRRLSTVGAVLN
jgi:asparagine synthase (glutamine-hydrolysing)